MKLLLRTMLRDVEGNLPERFRLPVDPAMEVTGIDVQRCGVFSSNAAPLRLVFKNAGM